ncbi:hypothetical protein LAZ67_1006967 [Cordylochernes scorpioides]|uniref:Transposase n=1 Tax=Cordylochernes scorpioides TaxID=51811 RepID=A0ABY6JYX8_9ARAC|nr:hypothetical protein LAZ67_1006967 [Cordylochernes scorpioides]
MPGHRKRRQFKQTDAFTRGMVIGLKRAGWSIRQIAADTHLGASTVHRLWRRWLEQGNVAIYRNVGATRVTSARVDRRILRQAVAAPQATCTAILQHVQDTRDHSISTRTISRRLVANGLHSCRPLRRLSLTRPNRRQRLEWCRARSTWMTEWHRVVFSDESRFCLSSDSRRVRVWRRRGERSNPAAIVERPTVRQRGIMVWGAIAYDSRSPLLRIQGTMTAQRYVDDVLRPVTLPYLQGVPNALYQQDNARPHTARISQQALQDVQMLPWPPYSPDLSPIEHVWDIIGRRLHAFPQPRSEDELWQMVEREWRAIPQDAIRTLIDSLPRRVAACIAVREWSELISLNIFDLRYRKKCQTRRMTRLRPRIPPNAISFILKRFRTVSRSWVWCKNKEIGFHMNSSQETSSAVFARANYCSKDKIGRVFLHRIVTRDEKWIHYDNPKRRKSWGKPCHASTSTAKPNIHGKKLMLCIWWDQLRVIYYELLQSNETITGERYQQHLMRLSRALTIKRPLYVKRHDKVIYQHDNTRPHVAKVVKETLEALQWDVLPHPPYSPDIAPSDYHMFRSMTHGLAEQHFTSYEEAKNWVDVWIASKDEEFFRHGIRMLFERWKKFVAKDGQYFE